MASLFHPKAKLWVDGRRDLMKKLEHWRSNQQGDLIWIHCASLGEFEQGRPIIEAIKKESPTTKILLTFFSPSGYEIRKNYAYADFICYLPADTPRNAARFLEIAKPKAVLFVKYEYWANYFFKCREKNIALYIVSGILRKDQRFFGVFSSFWKKVLDCVTHFFVQSEETQTLLLGIGFRNVTISGDSRFDRVTEIANNAKELPEIKQFKGNSFCVVAGSSWPQEEKMLHEWFEKIKSENVKLIIVPHEISASHISAIQKLFPQSVKWTERDTKNINSSQVLIIDAMGMLSSIYQYGDVAVIGGGFGKGIHNTLEAAVWKMPVLFGPKYHKFEEANELLATKGAYCFHDENELAELLSQLKSGTEHKLKSGLLAGSYVQSKIGATQIVMHYLKANKLITSA